MSNGAVLILMAVLFLLFGYMGVPVTFALIAGVLVAVQFTQISMQSMVGQLFHGIDAEALLMILCGVCLGMFTLTVFCDVVTRSLGAPWLWLQQVTTAFFAWGVFLGMAAATRRHDHFYLTEITKRMKGASVMVFQNKNINGYEAMVHRRLLT